MKLLYRFAKCCFKIYFKLFYRLEVRGAERIIPGKAIISSNHTSFLDPPVIAVCWPEEISFLARKTLFSSFFFGNLIKRLNAYPVAGTMQDLSSIKMVCKLLDEEKKVVIFPEGVRSFDGEFTPLKSGIGMLAVRCQAPIIPIYIHGCYQIWNRWQRFPKMWGKIICLIGTPIYPEEYMSLEKREVHKAIAEQLKISLHTLKQQIQHENLI